MRAVPFPSGIVKTRCDHHLILGILQIFGLQFQNESQWNSVWHSEFDLSHSRYWNNNKQMLFFFCCSPNTQRLLLLEKFMFYISNMRVEKASTFQMKKKFWYQWAKVLTIVAGLTYPFPFSNCKIHWRRCNWNEGHAAHTVFTNGLINWH